MNDEMIDITKIEVSPKEYWKGLTFNDSLLYCSLLTIDDANNWRMIKSYEEFYFLSEKINLERWKNTWFLTDVNQYENDAVLLIIPVRDI
jgi:hypothetical protein